MGTRYEKDGSYSSSGNIKEDGECVQRFGGGCISEIVLITKNVDWSPFSAGGGHIDIVGGLG